MKVHELAKKLGKTNDQVKDMLKELGFSSRIGHLSNVPDEFVGQLLTPAPAEVEAPVVAEVGEMTKVEQATVIDQVLDCLDVAASGLERIANTFIFDGSHASHCAMLIRKQIIPLAEGGRDEMKRKEYKL